MLSKNNRMHYKELDDIKNNNLVLLSLDPYFDGDSIQLKLQNILSQLSNKQRLVFQMKYFDDLSFKQIAEIVEINENTLKSTYYTVVKIIEEKIFE
jgi:RNA polymerase sigma-70 factor (ECF subfamily)